MALVTWLFRMKIGAILLLLPVQSALALPGLIQSIDGILEQAGRINRTGQILLLTAFAILSLILYLRNRSSYSNNMRKARQMHKKAAGIHRKGDEDTAEEFYEKARELREKAEALP